MYSLTIFLLLFVIIQTVYVYSMNLTEECERDYIIYKEAIRMGLQWARRMSDADGKEDSGRLTEGDWVYEGDYKQCSRVQQNLSDPDSIRGHHCLAYWPSLRGREGRGLCLPSACNEDDFFVILIETEKLPIGLLTLNGHCVDGEDLSGDPAAIVSIVILSLFGAIVVSATIFHYARHKVQWPLRGNHPSRQPVNNCEENSQKENGRHHTSNGCGANAEIYRVDDMGKDHNETVSSHINGFIPNMTSCTLEAHMNGSREGGQKSDVQCFQREVSISCASDYNCGASFTVPVHCEKSRNFSKRCKDVWLSSLLCFSLFSTVPRTLSAKHPPESFRCLNGIRFLSMSWIVLGHTHIIGVIDAMPTIANFYEIARFRTSVWYQAIASIDLAVDTFFVLSAMLVTVSFLRQIERQNGRITGKQMALYYFHRYWRLTPIYAVLIMTYTNLFYYFGDGPLFPQVFADNERCKDYWWKNLLYINNFNSQETSCFGWAWYLACDFQFYCMAPLFIAPFYFALRRGRLFITLALIWVGLGFCGSLISAIYLFHEYFTQGIGNPNDYFEIYVSPWARSSVYFMGIFLGFAVYFTRGKCLISKRLIPIGWTVAAACITLPVYLPFLENSSCTISICGEWTTAGKVAFSSLQRPMFALGVIWMIFACLTGHGGIVNSILSWNFWVPLSRLTYAGYLIHPILCYIFFFVNPVQVYISMWLLVYLFCGNIMLALGLALVMTLTFEVPLLALEKLFLPRK